MIARRAPLPVPVALLLVPIAMTARLPLSFRGSMRAILTVVRSLATLASAGAPDVDHFGL